MLHLTSGPVLMVEVGLAVFCLLDALLAPEEAVRWLPRWGWALSLLVFPLCGVILWIVAGRPWRAKVRGQSGGAPGAEPFPDPVPLSDSIAPPPQWLVPPTTGVYAPPHACRPAVAVDTMLARQLLEVHAEQEQTLKLWEADLRRREAALREAQARSTSKTG